MKFAVIKTGGKQYRVAKGDVIRVEKIAKAKDGKILAFKDVFLISDKIKTKIGTPKVRNAKVTAKVLQAEGRSKKVKTLKFKRKVRYLRHLGHRQFFTEVEITNISIK